MSIEVAEGEEVKNTWLYQQFHRHEENILQHIQKLKAKCVQCSQITKFVSQSCIKWNSRAVICAAFGLNSNLSLHKQKICAIETICNCYSASTQCECCIVIIIFACTWFLSHLRRWSKAQAMLIDNLIPCHGSWP